MERRVLPSNPNAALRAKRNPNKVLKEGSPDGTAKNSEGVGCKNFAESDPKLKISKMLEWGIVPRLYRIESGEEPSKGTLPVAHGCMFPTNSTEYTLQTMEEEEISVGDGMRNREWPNGGGRDLKDVGKIVVPDDEVGELGDPRVVVHGIGCVFQVVEVWVEVRGPKKERRRGGGAVAKEEGEDFAGTIRRWERLTNGWDHTVVLREGECDTLEVRTE